MHDLMKDLGTRIIYTLQSRTFSALRGWGAACVDIYGVRADFRRFYSGAKRFEMDGYDMWVAVMEIPVFPSRDYNSEQVNRVIYGYVEEISGEKKVEIFKKLHEIGRKYGHYPHYLVNRETVILIARRRSGFVRANARRGHFIFVKEGKRGEREWKAVIGQALTTVARWLKQRAEKLREAVERKGYELFGALRLAVEWVEAFARNMLAFEESMAHAVEYERRERRRALIRMTSSDERYASLERMKREAMRRMIEMEKAVKRKRMEAARKGIANGAA